MSNIKKPVLPNPGEGRWWVIAADEDDDYTLLLMKYNATRDYNEDVVLSTRYIRSYEATTATFETAARNMLEAVSKREAFEGTYKFEEQN